MRLSKLKTYADMVMFSHTLFSLPFALVSMLLASNGLPKVRVIFWIVVAFIGARNGANALNRIVDKDIDAKNPRTAGRHLPSGKVKVWEVAALTVSCFGLLILASFELNPLCVKLLPVAILLFLLYSYTKRFTWACHIILGIICAGAPVGAWVAVRGEIGWPSLVIAAANALWVAGFDIIYGSQDVDFDRGEGLYSIPGVFGVKNALLISSAFHVAAILILVYLFFLTHMGWLYLVGVGIDAALLILEHRMVSPTDLKNVKLASYNINEIVSVVFFVFSTIDILFFRA
jgi:4-hydroxybenzoate polyprenyltransferase